MPLKALVLVSLAGQVREIALQTKRGFPCFSYKKLRFKIITETISANPALDKTFAFTIIKNRLCNRVVTMLICIIGDAREGKRL